jgi:hypothetical protein
MRFVIDVEFYGPDGFSDSDFPSYTKKTIKFMESWIKDSLFSPEYSSGETALGFDVKNGEGVEYEIKSLSVKGQKPFIQNVV